MRWTGYGSLLLVTGLAICTAGCGRDDDGKSGRLEPSSDPPEVVSVKATMDASCRYKDGYGTVRSSKKNVGNVVQMGPAIYLVREGKVFAGNEAAKKCSPKLPMTKELTPEDLDL